MSQSFSTKIFFPLTLFILLTFCHCKSQKQFKNIYADTSQTVNAIRVSTWQLLPIYEGKFIEIEGVYRHRFEMSALFPSENIVDTRKAIWIDLTRNLTNLETKKQLFDERFTELQKLYNKRVKITGVFDKNNQGHLDAYSGGITNIMSIEIMN